MGWSRPEPAGDQIRREIEAFLLAFDSNMAPIVGQQVTLSASTAAAVTPRIDLLIARAEAGECDLVVKGTRAHKSVGILYVGSRKFKADRQAAPLFPAAALGLLAQVPGQEITYTATPAGSGMRIGIDRDEDGFLDGDEVDAGSNPADPNDTP